MNLITWLPTYRRKSFESPLVVWLLPEEEETEEDKEKKQLKEKAKLEFFAAIEQEGRIQRQGSVLVCAQPMRDIVTL